MTWRRAIAALLLTSSLLACSACTPEDLIRIRWAATTDGDRMVEIARRESGLQCDPPRTGNGAGLFQLAGKGKQQTAAALGWTWEEVRTDCMKNIEIAWRVYLACGMGPWHAPDWPCWAPHWR